MTEAEHPAAGDGVLPEMTEAGSIDHNDSPGDCQSTADSAMFVDLAEVYRWSTPYFLDVGRVPVAGCREWCLLPEDSPAKLTALVVAGIAKLVEERDVADRVEAEVARRWKRIALDLSHGENWSAIATSPSHAELQRRRAQPGPLAHTVDPVAVRRWVATGSSRAEGRAA